MSFFLKIPKSFSKKKIEAIENNDTSSENYVYHTRKIDLDNAAYLVSNSLKGIVYKDDSQIYEMHLSKRYSLEPKTIAIIEW